MPAQVQTNQKQEWHCPACHDLLGSARTPYQGQNSFWHASIDLHWNRQALLDLRNTVDKTLLYLLLPNLTTRALKAFSRSDYTLSLCSCERGPISQTVVFQGGFFCFRQEFSFSQSYRFFSFILSGPCWGPCNNPHQKKKFWKTCFQVSWPFCQLVRCQTFLK